MDYQHTPVLLTEAVEILGLKNGDCVVDATLGGAGYSRALLEKVGTKGKVLSIDLDSDAIKHYQGKIYETKYKNSVLTAHGNFADISQIVTRHDFGPVKAIVADIGLSSHELDNSGRGFSFQKDEPLDMRFDVRQKTDAATIINNHSEKDLALIFRKYGEDNFSSRIAKHTVRAREDHPIKRTSELVEIIKEALPKPIKHRYADSARRIFQALRIAVNNELDNLETFLPRALDILAPGGVLALVSFHSLEDSIVKQFFVESAKGCVCPLEFPICQCGRNPRAKILTKKPIKASEAELKANLRSKPAKLRAIQKY